MSLNLDARQRAMLQEMRIPFWWPDADAEAPFADEREPDRLAESSSLATPARDVPVGRAREPHGLEPISASVSTPVSAPMAAPSPQAQRGVPAAPGAAQGASPGPQAQAQALGAAPGWQWLPALPLYDSPDAPGGWLVVTEAVWAGNDPLADPAGRLLDAMLKALRLQPSTPVWLAGVQRAQAGDGEPQATAGLAQVLGERRPQMVLLMGLAACRAALGSDAPLGRLRGQLHDLNGVPAVVTYDPRALLRTQSDKAKAWLDLCLALDAVATPAP